MKKLWKWILTAIGAIIIGILTPHIDKYISNIKYDNTLKKDHLFTIVNNLSDYSLMPNPTYKEWLQFNNENFKNNTLNKKLYNQFLKLKNNIENYDLYLRPYSMNDSSDGNTLLHIHKKLLELNKEINNSLVDYYIGITKFYFNKDGANNIASLLIKLNKLGLTKYKYDLEQIALSIKDNNILYINKNNHLLNPHYYIIKNKIDKIKNLTLINSFYYSSEFYNIILKDFNISSRLKFKLIKKFLNKNLKFKKLNGNILLSAYINLININNINDFIKYLDEYPIEYQYKRDLYILLSLNKYVDLVTLKEILKKDTNFLNRKEVIKSNFIANLKLIKKDSKFFYKILNPIMFEDMLNDKISLNEIIFIQSIKNYLPIFKYKEYKKNINKISFLFYLMNHKIKLNGNFYYIHIKLKYLKQLFTIHNINSSYKEIKKEYILKNFINTNLIQSINYLNKQTNKFILSKEKKEFIKFMNNMNNIKIKKYILSLIEYDKIKHNIKILDTIIYDIKKIIENNKILILNNKYSFRTFKKDLKKLLEQSIKKIKILDKTSCQILYFYNVYQIYTKEEPILHISKKILEEKLNNKCINYYAEHKKNVDFIIYNLKDTVLEKYFNFSKYKITTDINKIDNKIYFSNLEFIKLLNYKFYKTNNSLLKTKIDTYKRTYDKFLIENLLLIFLEFNSYNNNLSINKYLFILNQINDLKGGYYEFSINSNDLRKSLGLITFINYKTHQNKFIRSTFSYGFSLNQDADLNCYFDNHITNLKMFKTFLFYVNLKSLYNKNRITQKDIIKLLVKNFKIKNIINIFSIYIIYYEDNSKITYDIIYSNIINTNINKLYVEENIDYIILKLIKFYEKYNNIEYINKLKEIRADISVLNHSKKKKLGQSVP